MSAHRGRAWALAAIGATALELVGTLAGGACRPEPPTERRGAAPETIPEPPPPLHPATPAGIALGRRLFFERRLSGHGRISCATCHDPGRAFTDGVALATHGASGRLLPRNAPPLFNLAWASALFWDGGAKNLESLIFGPLTHPDEMAADVPTLIARLEADADMRAAFADAFPGLGVTPATIMRALAQYVRSLTSFGSRYDRHRRGEPDGALTPAEHRGLALARARCGGCHAGELFTDHDFHDIGLDPPAELALDDPRRGRARVSFAPSDERAYRTPSLRNLGYTAPYMHDGRFATLEQVLNHYRFGTHQTPSLAKVLRRPDGQPGLALSDVDLSDLRAFLSTLDDPAFVAHHVRDGDAAAPPTQTLLTSPQ